MMWLRLWIVLFLTGGSSWWRTWSWLQMTNWNRDRSAGWNRSDTEGVCVERNPYLTALLIIACMWLHSDALRNPDQAVRAIQPFIRKWHNLKRFSNCASNFHQQMARSSLTAVQCVHTQTTRCDIRLSIQNISNSLYTKPPTISKLVNIELILFSC